MHSQKTSQTGGTKISHANIRNGDEKKLVPAAQQTGYLAPNQYSDRFQIYLQRSLTNYSYNTVTKANWLPFSVICKG